MAAGGENRPPVARAKIIRMLVVGAIASALGIAAGLAIDWFPAQGSTQAHKIDTLWDVLVIVSVPVFVLVATVVVFSVIEFRQKPGEELADGPPIHGNTRLEVVWTAVPAIILVSLCSYAYVVLHDVEKAPAATAGKELKVDVYGQQFTWTFKYPKEVGGKEFSSNQLYVPNGRSVQFRVHSADVIHDFWVPDWRMKIDAVPGITTKYRITPRLLGRHAIVCAELCGLGHAYMRQTAHVLTPAAFAAWVKRQGAPAPAAGGAAGGGGKVAAVDGKKMFTQGNGTSTPCASCHQLADAGSPPGVGPNLDKNIATWTPAQVKEAIVDPQKTIAKGYPSGVMPPNFGQVLKPQELDALVQYLVKATHKQ